MKRMKLSEIKILPEFAESIPNEEKVRNCRYNWRCYRRQDRYIVVDNEGYLIDGYIMFLILKEHKEEYAEVKMSNCKKNPWYRKNTEDWDVPMYKNNPTTYIYGMHPNDKYNNLYIWRVPDTWFTFAENVQVGDIILCTVRLGHSPVIVTKIVILDEPPINLPIKKVYSKKIFRNGMEIEY